MQEQSPSDSEQDVIARFGPVVGPIYYDLRDQVLELHLKWSQYRTLYAHSQARVDVLNRTAPTFFTLIQTMLRDDILLSIARLNDPAEQGKELEDGTRPFKNQSLRQLGQAVEQAFPDFYSELESLIRLAGRKADFAQRWRNRRIAHRELTYALDPAAKPLPDIAVARVDAVLAAIRGVMNQFEPDVDFSEPFALGDAESLASWLEAAIRDRELRRQSRMSRFR